MRQSNQKKFKIYRSSAGSGKTFTLVKEYLKLVLQTERDSYFRHICAITFTKKAANEMKERILDNLSEFSKGIEDGKHAQMRLSIIDDCQISEDDLKLRAGKVLSQILHHYSEFKISTIDSFLHRIIRTFSYELDLPSDMEIEMDSDLLIDEAVERLFAEANENKLLSDFLLDFISKNTEDDRSWRIKREIREYAKNIFKEDAVLNDRDLKKLELDDFLKLRKDLSAKNKEAKVLIEESMINMRQLLDSRGLTQDDFAGKSRGFVNYLEGLNKDISKVLSETQERVFLSEDWANKAATESAKQAIAEIREQVTALYNLSIKASGIYLDNQIILRNIHNIALYHRLKSLIAQVKIEQKVLHISEFNERISDLLRQEPIPYIYERVGEKLNHYLIDEFQDTSKLQWFNLIPLVENSLAKAEFNMVVGDAKQSIYRFRNGDMMQFVNLPEVRDAWTGKLLPSYPLFQDASSEEHLDKNYRSKAEIVDFNNELYGYLKEELREDLREVYRQHEQIPNKEKGAYVSVKLFDSKEITSIDELLYDEVLNAIKESMDDGFEPEDICILTRTNREASALAHSLSSDGFKVVTEDSLQLMNNDAVQAVLNIMRYIDHPKEQQYQADALRYLHKCNESFNWKEILRKVLKKELNFEEALSAYGYRFDWLSLKKQLRLEQLIEISRVFQLELGIETSLSQFAEVCAQFDRNIRYLHHEFFDYLDKRQSSFKTQIKEAGNAIKLMTVFKSKGLEFPVVILPYTGWQKMSHSDFKWTKKTSEISSLQAGLISLAKTKNTRFNELQDEEDAMWMADNINLLYVATTRPTDRLYLSCASTRNQHFYKTLSEKLLLMKAWNTAKSQLILGERTKNTRLKKELKHQKNTPLQAQMLPWHESFELSVADIEVYKSDWKSPRNKGKILHQLLSEGKDIESIENRLQYLKSIYFWDEQQCAEINQVLLNLKESPEIRNFFDKDSELLIERDFIDSKSQVFRPDRILKDGNKLSLLDFKSGQEKEEDKAQVNYYKAELENMGYTVESSSLYYLLDSLLIET